MTAPYLPDWHWKCSVVAPTGERIPGTDADSKGAAVQSLFGNWSHLWPYAIQNGYRLHWFRVER